MPRIRRVISREKPILIGKDFTIEISTMMIHCRLAGSEIQVKRLPGFRSRKMFKGFTKQMQYSTISLYPSLHCFINGAASEDEARSDLLKFQHFIQENGFDFREIIKFKISNMLRHSN